MPYGQYVAYRQAEEAFRALYFGRPFNMDSIANRPSAKIVQQHWSTVEKLADMLLSKKSPGRDELIKVLMRASLDGSPIA